MNAKRSGEDNKERHAYKYFKTNMKDLYGYTAAKT